MLTGAVHLHWAAKNGYPTAIDALLNAGADIDARDRERCTPLHWAAQNGHTNAITTLLDAGADPMAQTANGLTPRAVAQKQGRTEIAAVLAAAEQHANPAGE